jgi:hypothetical protein
VHLVDDGSLTVTLVGGSVHLLDTDRALPIWSSSHVASDRYGTVSPLCQHRSLQLVASTQCAPRAGLLDLLCPPREAYTLSWLLPASVVSDGVTCSTVSASGSLVIFGTTSGWLLILDTRTGWTRCSWNAHASPVQQVGVNDGLCEPSARVPVAGCAGGVWRE